VVNIGKDLHPGDTGSRGDLKAHLPQNTVPVGLGVIGIDVDIPIWGQPPAVVDPDGEGVFSGRQQR